MLTEIAVVLSLDVVGLAVAIALGRWTLRCAPGGVEARRLLNAALRASEAFLWREGKLAAAATAVVMVLVLGMNGLFVARRIAGFTTSAMLWAGFGTILGAVLTVSVGYVTAAVGLRATLRTIRASQGSLDQFLALAVRAGGASALGADAVGAAAVAGLFGLVYLLGGGGGQLGAGPAAALLGRAVAVLPGFCLGSVASALVLGVGGAAYHAATSVSGLAVENVDANDPRNPALVAMLVGEHVGLGARRSVDMFAATTLASIAMLLVGVAAFGEDANLLGGHAWALVTLPLLVRAVGVVASAFGLMTTRAAESGRAVDALFRGQLTAGILVIGGLAGAALWLVGAQAFGWFTAAGTFGVALGFLSGHVARRHVDRRLGPTQNLLEATRARQHSLALALARGMSTGMRGALLPLALLVTTLCASWQLGERSHLAGGGLLATATTLAGLLATSAYMLAVGLLGPIASGALTIAALDPDGLRPDVRRRMALLDDAGFEGGAVAESFFIVLGGAAALVAGLSITLGAPAASGMALSMSRLEAVGAGALGAGLVWSLAGSALEVANRTARGGVLEIERQLRGFPRENGTLSLPAGYTPSYRSLIDLTGRLAAEGLFWPICVGLLGPAALGFALRVLYTNPGQAKEGLTCFVVVATVTGLGMSLSADGARAVLSATYRASRPRGSSEGFEVALAGHGFGTLVGGAAAPATHLFIKAAAAAAILVAPFLSGF